MNSETRLESRIDSITLSIARVTPSTHWTFVEIVDQYNRRGWGEATLTGQDDNLLHAANDLFPQIAGMCLNEVARFLQSHPLNTLAYAAIVSALSHARNDLIGQLLGRPIAALHGQPVRDTIPLYANINRRTRSREPHQFAQSAQAALAAGYNAIKIAPFDGVALYGAPQEPDQKALDLALERIAAVRDAIGPSVELMVDCHWRLNSAVARDVLSSEICTGLHWLECPIPETPENLPELRALRSFANQRGIRLAGCEEAMRVEGFLPFVNAEAYDVMMPDVKYVGGVAQMIAVAQLLDRHGIEFSPHNPSGPVAHAVSLQICAIVKNFRRLETQFDETPFFKSLCGSSLPVMANGKSSISTRPGIGIRIDRKVLESLTTRQLTINVEQPRNQANGV
jgi:galactonate dehydratase